MMNPHLMEMTMGHAGHGESSLQPSQLTAMALQQAQAQTSDAHDEGDGGEGVEGDTPGTGTKGEKKSRWRCAEALERFIRKKQLSLIPDRQGNVNLDPNEWPDFVVTFPNPAIHGDGAPNPEEFALHGTRVAFWAPDIFFQQFVPRMPCKNATCPRPSVSSHGWNSHGPRKVICVDGHYWLYSKRYKCASCGTSYNGHEPNVLKLLPPVVRAQLDVIMPGQSSQAIDMQLAKAMKRVGGRGKEAAKEYAELLKDVTMERYNRNRYIYYAAHKTLRDVAAATAALASGASPSSLPFGLLSDRKKTRKRVVSLSMSPNMGDDDLGYDEMGNPIDPSMQLRVSSGLAASTYVSPFVGFDDASGYGGVVFRPDFITTLSKAMEEMGLEGFDYARRLLIEQMLPFTISMEQMPGYPPNSSTVAAALMSGRSGYLPGQASSSPMLDKPFMPVGGSMDAVEAAISAVAATGQSSSSSSSMYASDQQLMNADYMRYYQQAGGFGQHQMMIHPSMLQQMTQDGGQVINDPQQMAYMSMNPYARMTPQMLVMLQQQQQQHMMGGLEETPEDPKKRKAEDDDSHRRTRRGGDDDMFRQP